MDATTRRYRATVIPADVSPADAELKADQGVLPTVQFRARSTGHAERLAHAVTGRPVLRVERIEGVA
jgi:hypothetical protein